MNTNHAALFQTIKFAGLDLPNRIAVAPMTRISAGPKGIPTLQMADYYADYVDGGFGLIVTEGTYIDEQYSQGYRNQPGIANDEQAEGWRRIVDAVHKQGGKIVLQLIHAGALVQHNDYTTEAIAPSAVQPKGEQMDRYYGSGQFPVPRAMTIHDIEETVAAYANAALRAKNAGFDGIELHGANGYLPDQFLTEYANERTDGYGGPTSNRVRFHCEIIAAIRKAVGPDFCAGVRISETKINDHNYSWSGEADDARTIFTAVENAGASYIHISAHKGISPIFGGEQTLSGLARSMTNLPVIACGKLEDPNRAASLIESGETDLVALGKAALADSHWPTKIKLGKTPLLFDMTMMSPVATLEVRRRF